MMRTQNMYKEQSNFKIPIRMQIKTEEIKPVTIDVLVVSLGGQYRLDLINQG